MKKSILSLSAIAFFSLLVNARGIKPVGLDNISFGRQGDIMVVGMDFGLAPTEVGSSRAQVMTPLIVSESGDTVALPPVGVYGRQRYLQYLRGGRHPLGSPDEAIVRVSERPESLPYAASVAYEDWMANSSLLVRRSLYGCADCLVEESLDTVTGFYQRDPAIPEIVYFQAADQGPKVDTLDGSAFIDFPVNKTVIYPEYRNNVRELGKIRATIDTVYNDKDVTITGVWLKGYASPESPYSHNRDLAIGRTASLKGYIGGLYKFPDNIISTDFEPEDWEGLRRFVAASDIENREDILAMIDSGLEPDAKEAKIKRTYPKQYRFMLQNYYPALRHTDYRITYEVKRYDDVEEIREVMRTKPNRLSLREFFILGNAAVPGSDEFNAVYETAVRMYPDDPVANINAANAALQRKDYVTAERYLERAGDSPEAVYARGALAFLKEDYDKAERLMRQASSIAASRSTLDEIAKLRAAGKEKVTKLMLE